MVWHLGPGTMMGMDTREDLPPAPCFSTMRDSVAVGGLGDSGHSAAVDAVVILITFLLQLSVFPL